MNKIMIGDKIHIKSRQGIYTVVKTTRNEIFLTCKIWSYSETPIRVTTYDDFKCFAGGIWRIK
jgi:hypothetical protein